MISKTIISIMLSIFLFSCQERNKIKSTQIQDSSSFKVNFIEIIVNKNIKDSTKFLEKEYNFKANAIQLIGSTKEVIPDAKTAANLAFVILSKYYGDNQIKSKLPFKIINFGKYWIISGTLKTELGGTAELILRKKDGAVLKIIHYK